MAGWVSQAFWKGIWKIKVLPPQAFEFRIVYHAACLFSRADEVMARVPKMARANISLARGVHCCPIFLNLFCPTSVSRSWRISDCVETVYELPLLPNNTAVKYFCKSLERCEELTRYLSFGRRPGGEWANKWHWTKHFTIFFSNGKQ